MRSACLATLLLALTLLPVSLATASRAPSKAERGHIRAAALHYCQNHQEDPSNPDLLCEWRGGIRVSTVNRHYAWAEVSGPHYDSSGILKKVKGTRNWRMVRTMGGGILSCEYWYEAIPRRIVHDLRVEGFTEGDQSFDYHRC